MNQRVKGIGLLIVFIAVNFNLGGLLGGLNPNRQNTQNKNNNNQRLDLAGIGLNILGNVAGQVLNNTDVQVRYSNENCHLNK